MPDLTCATKDGFFVAPLPSTETLVPVTLRKASTSVSKNGPTGASPSSFRILSTILSVGLRFFLMRSGKNSASATAAAPKARRPTSPRAQWSSAIP